MAKGWSKRTWAFVLCGALCALYTILAWTAVSGKSATWDEPSHAATGWLMLWRHDYRLSPDVPPLWEYWIALPDGPGVLHFDPNSPAYRQLHAKIDLFRFCVDLLYRTPGNNGIALVRRGRAMALILAVALPVILAVWAWQLAGLAAAVAAAFLYCLDPNFLGHGPLVKNDVGFALVYFAAAYAIWRCGRRLTWGNTIAAILLIAVSFEVKLSGVLLAPVLILALSARAAMAEPWMMYGRWVRLRTTKFAAVATICILTALASYGGLWASYGFRFNAGPDAMRSDTAYFLRAFRQMQVMAKVGKTPTAAEVDAWRMPLSTRMVLFLEHHHLAPQAWTSGYILSQFSDQGRAGFIWGMHYTGGRWFYFPLAAIFKTPLATLAALVLAIIVGRRALKHGLLESPADRWSAIALLVPAVIYGGALLSVPLNIGLRHAFPLYPLIYLAMALAIKRVWDHAPAKARQASGGQALILLLAAALAAETAAAYPNYIDFFNVAFASRRLSLLGDSNLDWGQDLPLLARWQRRHPDQTLYLDYFGLCDPAAYGIRYVNVPQGYLFGPRPVWPTKPGVVAISATNLQQIYVDDPRSALSTIFQDRTPLEVLGGTIYLFDFNPADFAPKARN